MLTRFRMAALLAVALVLAGCAPAAPPANEALAPEVTPEAPRQPGEPRQPEEPRPPEAAAADGPLAFTAVDLAGAEVDLAELAGEPVVLWFWAPWCSICRGEGPHVADVAAALADDVTFIGVAGLGEASAMEAFVADTDTGGFTHLADDDGSLWRRFGVTYQPAYAFISPDGVVEVLVGALGAAELTERAEALL